MGSFWGMGCVIQNAERFCQVKIFLATFSLRKHTVEDALLLGLKVQVRFRGGSTGGQGAATPNKNVAPSGHPFWPSLPRLSLK